MKKMSYKQTVDSKTSKNEKLKWQRSLKLTVDLNNPDQIDLKISGKLIKG